MSGEEPYDLIPHKEILKLMKNAGCVSILYGIESLNQKSLDIIKKDINVKEMIDGVLDLIRKGTE